MPERKRILNKLVASGLVLYITGEIPHFPKREEEPSLVRSGRSVLGEHTHQEHTGSLKLQPTRPVAVATPRAAPPFVDNSAMLEAANQAVFARWHALRDHPSYYTEAFSGAPVIWHTETSGPFGG